MNHYDIRRVANNRFPSYFISLESNIVSVKMVSIAIWSIFIVVSPKILFQEPLLFFKIISTILLCNHTNPLNYNHPVKRMNNKVNQDLNNLTNFQDFQDKCSYISFNLRIQHSKLPDKITQKNCLFMKKCFNKFLPTIFENWFTLSSDFHACSTCWSNLGFFTVPPANT